MKIKYQPLCQGATAILADAVLKDYGDVKEVCSECGVPVGEVQSAVKTIYDVLLDCYHAGSMGERGRTIHQGTVAQWQAQLEAIMQDYAIEARLSENRRSAAGENSIQTLRKLKARERELEQLRTTN